MGDLDFDRLKEADFCAALLDLDLLIEYVCSALSRGVTIGLLLNILGSSLPENIEFLLESSV